MHYFVRLSGLKIKKTIDQSIMNYYYNCNIEFFLVYYYWLTIYNYVVYYACLVNKL